MYADEELLATLSRATAETLLAELREQHRDSGRTVDQTLAAIEARLQAISEQAKQDAIKDRFAIAKAEREAGGVGAERRFDQALKEIDVVSAAWDESVRGAFAQSVREWEETGEPVLGSGGWVVVSVTAYQPGSIWWTDAPRIAGWRTTIAREVFFSVTRDDRPGPAIRLSWPGCRTIRSAGRSDPPQTRCLPTSKINSVMTQHVSVPIRRRRRPPPVRSPRYASPGSPAATPKCSRCCGTGQVGARVDPDRRPCRGEKLSQRRYGEPWTGEKTRATRAVGCG